MKVQYTALQCVECELINVIDSWYADGLKCKCGGRTVRLGKAVVIDKEENKQSIKINIGADTTDLDIAIAKAKELKMLLNSLSR